MTEPRTHRQPPAASSLPRAASNGPHAGTGPTDAELDARSIVGFGIGLAILIVVVLGAVWLLSAGLKSSRASRDPEPSPLAEVNAPRLPPEPRLQTTPNEDMGAMRERENTVLTSYGPVDRATNTARIPIDRAIEILARTGLPEPAPLPPQAPAASSASGPSGQARPASSPSAPSGPGGPGGGRPSGGGSPPGGRP